MQGLRRTNNQGKASDNLARLTLNTRAVQLISKHDPSDTDGLDNDLPSSKLGLRDRDKHGSKRGNLGAGVVEATAAAATTVKTVETDEDTADVVDAELKERTTAAAKKATPGRPKLRGKPATSGIRSRRHTTRRAVKRSVVAAQRRRMAAKTAKTAVRTGATASRIAATKARIAAAAAHAVKVVVSAVASAASSTSVLTAIVVVLAVVVAVVALFSFLAPASSATCDMTTGSQIDPTKVPDTVIAGYGHEQLVNAAHIIQAGQNKGLSVRDQTIGVMTAIGESGLNNIDYGDWETGGVVNPDGSPTTSIGLFQQQEGWGTAEERLDPYRSSELFFEAMISKVPEEERNSLAPTLIAHKVQVNVDPFHYEPYWPTAVSITSALSGLDSDLLSGGSVCDVTPGIPGEIGLDGWAKPANGPITSTFGPREVIQTPSGSTVPFHTGVDFQADGCGGPIWAAGDGVVSNTHGTIIIDHGDGVETHYRHSYPDDVLVQLGQSVQAGDQIARTGAYGFATGCHLHFEIHLNGTAVDPLPILTDAGFTF